MFKNIFNYNIKKQTFQRITSQQSPIYQNDYTTHFNVHTLIIRYKIIFSLNHHTKETIQHKKASSFSKTLKK